MRNVTVSLTKLGKKYLVLPRGYSKHDIRWGIIAISFGVILLFLVLPFFGLSANSYFSGITMGILLNVILRQFKMLKLDKVVRRSEFQNRKLERLLRSEKTKIKISRIE